MIISPKTAILEGWITHPDCNSYGDWEARKYVNPNAIDFTIDRLFAVKSNPNQVASITETFRSFHETFEIEGPVWTLASGGFFDCVSNMHVTVPEGVACLLVNRSTFNRCGIQLNSGLYDSGYNGAIGFSLHNRSDGSVVTEPGTRVGQIMFLPSDSIGSYDGIYNNGQGGKHWKETQ